MREIRLGKRFALYAISALGLAALSACGGGGVDGGIDAPSGLRLMASETLTVPGVATTDDNLITDIKWQVNALDMNAPELLLSNDTCAIKEVNDRVFTAAGTTRTGASRWVCDLGIIAPDQVTKSFKYNLLLTATTDRNEVKTFKQELTVVPNPNAPPITDNYGAAGRDFSIAMGKTAPLNCTGSGGTAPYTYQWLIVDNAGLPLSLSSYSSQQSSLTAPAVKQATPVKIGCRVTDAKNRVRNSFVTVTITPTSTDTLIASTPAGVVAAPGVPTTITGTAGWFDVLGNPGTGPIIKYQWSLGASAPAGTKLLTTTNRDTQLVAPTNLTEPVYIPVVFTASSVDQTSSSTVEVLVDPFGPLNLTLEPAAQNVAPGAIVKIEGKATPGTTDGGSASLYYQWTVVTGPAVQLGGANTKTVQFVAPSVTAPTTMTLRLAVGYKPITATYPGIYFADAVVQVGAGAPTEVTAATISPVFQSANSGATVTATGGGGGLYHKWEQISGPQTLTLYGVNTATVTFQAPTVAVNEVYVLRYTTSKNGPITATNPGVFENTTITIQP